MSGEVLLPNKCPVFSESLKQHDVWRYRDEKHPQRFMTACRLDVRRKLCPQSVEFLPVEVCIYHFVRCEALSVDYFLGIPLNKSISGWSPPVEIDEVFSSSQKTFLRRLTWRCIPTFDLPLQFGSKRVPYCCGKAKKRRCRSSLLVAFL